MPGFKRNRPLKCDGLKQKLFYAENNHKKHYHSVFTQPRIVERHIISTCLICHKDFKVSGSNLSRHECYKTQKHDISSATTPTASSVPPPSGSTAGLDEGQLCLPSTSSAIQEPPVNDDHRPFVDLHLQTTTVKKGFCLFLNFRNFCLTQQSTNMLPNNREGSQLDVESLEETFQRLGADIKSREDLTYDQVIEQLKDLQNIDWNLYDHLVVAIMSHGRLGRFTTADCREVDIYDIQEHFSGKNFPGLLGKPKIFFLNVCRGNQLNEIMNIMGPPDSPFSPPEEPTGGRFSMEDALPRALPATSEFFLAWACLPRFKAVRNTYTGSLFIQEICRVIDKYHNKLQLSDMMTIVNRNVANNSFPTGHLQMPVFESSLTRMVRFEGKGKSLANGRQN